MGFRYCCAARRPEFLYANGPDEIGNVFAAEQTLGALLAGAMSAPKGSRQYTMDRSIEWSGRGAGGPAITLSGPSSNTAMNGADFDAP